MKKKILAISLAVALLAIMVTGTLAYFTDNDAVNNTFTVGSVKIEIHENGEKTSGEFKDLGTLVPVVNTETPAEDPGYIDKVVKIENNGKNSAYIRAFIAVPTNLIGYLHLELDEAGWIRQPDATANITVKEATENYTIFTYDYNTAVEPSKFTSELLKGVYLGSDVDLKVNPANAHDPDLEFCKPNANGGYDYSGFVIYDNIAGDVFVTNNVYVLVAAQAIQAQGFGDATTALNSGFATHPWG
jgi:predicted ribosomally synthesized peptide with SipW-like signal peptide